MISLEAVCSITASGLPAGLRWAAVAAHWGEGGGREVGRRLEGGGEGSGWKTLPPSLERNDGGDNTAVCILFFSLNFFPPFFAHQFFFFMLDFLSFLIFFALSLFFFCGI